MLDRRAVLGASAFAVGSLLARSGAWAQTGGQFRLIVPYAAGGPTDVQARLISEPLGEALGARVIVENRVGAGVVVGTDAVAKAQPDGQTVLLTTVAHAINPTLFPKLPFDTQKDFAPIALVARVPLVLLIRKDLPVRDMREFIAWVRDQRGQATYGSAGIGSAPHAGAALLLKMEKLDAVHVPYRGSGPAMTDLAAGRLDFYIDAAASGLAQVKGGLVRALAWSMLKRSQAAPDLPTFDEQGVRGYEAYTWSALFAPAGTPREIVMRINAAVRDTVAIPALRARFAEIGAELSETGPPEALAEFVTSEIKKWGEVVKETGMTVQ